MILVINKCEQYICTIPFINLQLMSSSHIPFNNINYNNMSWETFMTKYRTEQYNSSSKTQCVDARQENGFLLCSYDISREIEQEKNERFEGIGRVCVNINMCILCDAMKSIWNLKHLSNNKDHIHVVC